MKEYIVQAYAPETIKTFEEHNAPQIVRCKDCKHFDGLDCMVNDITNIMDTDWYCADGVRKDQNDALT